MASEFDTGEATQLFERALGAFDGLSNGDSSAADELRAALQGLALLDGVPAAPAAASMSAARALKELKSASDDETATLALVEAAIVLLRELFGTAEDEQEGSELEAPVAPDPEPDANAGEEVPAAKETAEPSPAAEAVEPAAPLTEPSGPVYMKGSDDPLLDEFLTEALEHLESAEEQLLIIEESPSDADALNSIFRSFHTVKGGAGILDLEEVSGFAHKAESVLDLAREGNLNLSGHPIDQCYAALDILRSMLQGLGSGEAEFELPGNYSETVAQLEAIASAVECIPGAAPAPAPVAAAAPSEPSATSDTEQKSQPQEAAPAELPQRDVVVPASAPASANAPKAKRKGASSVKISTERLDSMINLVGELVIASAMLHQEVEHSDGGGAHAPRSLSQLGKVTTELQHVAMSMRMVPLRATFQKSARIVRDVAAQCGKRVKFETNGEDTEIDRNVVERLGDPLIHMLRNAVDHGVEDPEARREAGKEEVGTIRLEAYHESGSVVIVLSDDGAGMRRDRILNKAIKNGLLSEEKAAQLPDSEVWQLIFHPGLSTAQQLSSVSGRGVGMDVVRKNIEALRGSIEIESTLGKGSRMIIRLPLTLAIIDAMVVIVGGRSYILPTLAIHNFLRPEEGSIHSVQGQGEVLSAREEILPIYRLSELLGIRGAVEDPAEGLLAITSAEGHEFALLVDNLKGQQQVVIKSMGTGDRRCPGVSGAAILGDGTVGLILDPAGLVRLALKHKNHNSRPIAIGSSES